MQNLNGRELRRSRRKRKTVINSDTKYLGRDKVEWVKLAQSSVDLRALVEQLLELRVSYSVGNAKTCWADYLSRSFND